jgi:hypothetical protein
MTTATKTYKDLLAEFKLKVELRVEKALIDSGHVDADGDVDRTSLQNAVYDAVTSRPLKTKKGKSDPNQSMTKGELYDETIPAGPSSDPALWDADGIDEAAHKALTRLVWDLVQTKPRGGHVQRRLDAEGSTLVLCRASVFRGSDIVRDGVFVTDDKASILEDALNGPLVLLEKAAAAAREYVDMIEDRHPELSPNVKAQIAQTLGRVQAALPAGSNGKVTTDDE